MSRRFTSITFALLAALCLTGAVSNKKKVPFLLGLHIETTDRDSATFSMPVNVLYPPMTVTVEKMSMVSQREVKAFYPGAETPTGYGAYFQFDPHGTKALESITTTHRDKFLVVIFNNRPICRLRVDRPVRDGILYVPTGISADELRTIGLKLPLINETAEQTRTRQRGR